MSNDAMTQNETKSDFISRELRERPSTPAFFDGYQLIVFGGSAGCKYDIDQKREGRYFLRESQILSKEGFERNLETWCAPAGGRDPLESSWEFPANIPFNASAEAYRLKWSEARKAEIRARIEREIADRERRDMEYRRTQEHRAAIDALLAASKWTKAQYPIADATGKTLKTVTGKVSGLVGVHKSENAQVWNITHIPSGMLMGQWDTQAQAKVAAVRFAQFNLDRTPVEIGNDKAVGDLYRAMRRTSDAYAEVL